MFSTVVGDSHELTRVGVQSALETMDVEVATTVRSGLEVFSAVDQHKPDLLILGLPFPSLDGLNLLYSLSRRRADVRVIVLDCDGTMGEARTAFERGASAYVLKHDRPGELRTAIETIRAGGQYLSSSFSRKPEHTGSRDTQTPAAPLSGPQSGE